MSRLERFYLASAAAVLAVVGWPGYATMTHGELSRGQLALDIATHVVGGIGWLCAHWSLGRQP